MITNSDQASVVSALARKGFTVNFNDGETVCLSKRLKGGTTLYAEVNAEGKVNGDSLLAFISWLATV